MKINKGTPLIYVFPNPVTDNFIQLQMNGLPKGDYKVALFNSQGQAVLTDKINHLAGTSTEKIQPDRKLHSGIYELKVTAPDKKVTVIKVIVN